MCKSFPYLRKSLLALPARDVEAVSFRWRSAPEKTMRAAPLTFKTVVRGTQLFSALRRTQVQWVESFYDITTNGVGSY